MPFSGTRQRKLLRTMTPVQWIATSSGLCELPRQMPESQSTMTFRSTTQSRASCQRKTAPRALPVRPRMPTKTLSRIVQPVAYITSMPPT